MLLYQSPSLINPAPYASRSSRSRIASQSHSLTAASASSLPLGQPQPLQEVDGVTVKIKGCFQQGLVVGLLLWCTRLGVGIYTSTAAYWCCFIGSVNGLQPS